ncbi:MAG: hypothetical protein KAY37_01080 [Phycisphaerae bacterium]|nr:hypothetical protein [Phycisphaerae bacterium]
MPLSKAKTILTVAEIAGRLKPDLLDQLGDHLETTAGHRQLADLLAGFYRLSPGVRAALVRRMQAEQGPRLKISDQPG